jgi:hypothetical protein
LIRSAIAAAAKIGRVDHHRVNHQRLGRIVSAQLKTDLTLRVERVAASDLLSRAVRFLIDHRLAQSDLPAGGLQHKVASFVHCQNVGAGEAQADDLGVGAGSDDEVVFQLPLGAVVNQIHSWINAPVFDFGVGGNAGAPPFGIAAREVVTLAGQFFQPGHLRRAVSAHELHSQQRWVMSGERRATSGIPHPEDGFCGGQEQTVAAAAREELDLAVYLTSIDFKAQRQLSVSFTRCGRGGTGPFGDDS